MTEKDKISDLPGGVLEQILSRLSVKDMVRTSLLSKKWRYKWATVPSLTFDKYYFPRSSTNCARVIDHVLLLHLGPVHRFELSCYEKLTYKEIDKWVLYVSRHSIKELVLRVWNPDFYSIPSCLFSCQGLTSLNLYYCSLSLPSMFEGFVNLKSLTLESVQVVQHDLENFISSSLVLERLTINQVFSVDQLNINAPHLLFFNIEGKFVDVCFKSVPHLTEICMNAESCNERLHFENPEEYGDLINLMVGIPQISRLKFVDYHTEYMSAGNIPRELPVPCVNLTSFSVSVFLGSFKEVSLLLCFLRSSPNLKELQITSFSFPHKLSEASSSVWEWDPTGWEQPFTHLQCVTVNIDTNNMGEHGEMDFVKFMLLNSPALQSMSMTIKVSEFINAYSYAMENQMLKKMLGFKRASPEAKIILR